MSNRARAKPVCFYLLQFHRIVENDAWWGEGFTEWSLVRTAQTVLASHPQPVAPHDDLGYYDLADPAIRRLQGQIARRYGVYGFCYYHYWFSGKRLLETPLELMLADGYPDLPFCLCWANEPWTRTWSGEGDVVLQPQTYGDRDDWIEHFDVLHRFLTHDNAITVDGRPLLLIYRPGHIPNLESMVQCWRRLALNQGLPGIYLVGVLGNFADNRTIPSCLDAGAEHHPGFAAGHVTPLVTGGVRVFSMEKVWSELTARPRVHPVQFPGACVHWDNTPRRRTGSTIYVESSASRTAGFLGRAAHRAVADEQLPEPFVFLNSWNEWSEGTYIELDSVTGYARLDTVKRGFDAPSTGFEPFPRDRTGDAGAPVHRDRLDIDGLNTLVASGIRADTVLEIGCRNGETGVQAGPFLGASYYLGTDDDPSHVAAASLRLHDSRVVAVDAFGQREPVLEGRHSKFELVVAFEALGYASDPGAVLAGLAALVTPEGLVLAGFYNRNHYKAVLSRGRTGRVCVDGGFRVAAAPEAFSVGDARCLLEGAGLELRYLYRVFSPSPPETASLRECGNRVVLGNAQFKELNPTQVQNLHCLRFFIVAGPAGNAS